jgi:gluconate 2-dehydrogenase gamma chain
MSSKASVSSNKKSRRSFLARSIGGINAAWIAANYPGILAAQEYAKGIAGQAPKLGFFTDAQGAEAEAITARIIPTDDTPGAREAHCLYFIDRALTTFAKNSQPAYTQGLLDLQAKTQQLYPDAAKFSALTPEQQIKVLTAIEKTPFFNLVRQQTVIGFFARPVHGGNFDKVGWKLIGYDDSLNFKPPFGYYDAQVKG